MALLAIAWLQLTAGFLLPTLPHRAVDSRHAPEADLPAHWRNSPTSWLPAEEASVLRLARVDTERLLQELLCDDGEHCATSRLARVAARVDAWVDAVRAALPKDRSLLPQRSQEVALDAFAGDQPDALPRFVTTDPPLVNLTETQNLMKEATFLRLLAAIPAAARVTDSGGWSIAHNLLRSNKGRPRAIPA